MSASLVLGIPPIVQDIIQKGLLERAFHDGLFPGLQFRAEAQFEKWEDHNATELVMSRAGLLTPITKPMVAGADPIPQTIAFEQWIARLARYAGTIDTYMPTSAVASADLFLKNIHQLGLQAGQSLNRIPRNELFKAYLSGHTATIAAALTTDTTIRVASLNGFTDVVIKGVNTAPKAVSAATPLPISITGVTGTRNVIGFSPDSLDDPYGPGTLQLDAQLGAAVAARASVLSAFRPQIIRSGGGTTVDAIGATDTFVIQDAINAVNRLRRQNVQPHEDGFFHAHISTEGNSQVFTDPVMQRLNTSLPDGAMYQEAFIGHIAGILFYLNNECPDDQNSGALTSTGTNARYSEDVGAETVNESGVRVGRIIITGRGAMYEKGLDEKSYMTEAGVNGKVGEFQVVNMGMEVKTERIRLYLRSPLNRLGDTVSASWSITTSFPIPSDITSGGPERYKRAIVIEHALD